MTSTEAEQKLIMLGVASLENTTSATERVAMLEAAARLLSDESLAERCSVTAAVIREAENAQLRLFKSLRN